MNTAQCRVFCFLAAFFTAVPALAQFSGDSNMVYDKAHNAYFVHGDATLSGDVSGNDVFVGKDNAAGLAAPPTAASITLDIASGATVMPKGISPVENQHGVQVFGSNAVAVRGGSVGEIFSHDAGRVTITGGVVYDVSAQHRSVVAVSGGTVDVVGLSGAATLDLTGTGLTLSYDGHAFVTNPAGPPVKPADRTQADIFHVAGVLQDGTAYTAAKPLVIFIEGKSDKPNSTPRQFTFNGITPSMPSLASFGAQAAFDRESNTYFVHGDTTLREDVSGNEIVVGKDNAQNFATLLAPAPIMLTLAEGVKTGARVRVFGWHQINVTGGYAPTLSGYENSAINVSGGLLGTCEVHDFGAVNIRGGSVDVCKGEGNAAINISGGGFSLRGGAIREVRLRGSSSAHLTGTGLSQRYGRYDKPWDQFYVTGSLPDGTAYSREHPLLIALENKTGRANPAPRQFTFNGIVPVAERTAPALPQFSGGHAVYDRERSAYFVHGDATLRGDVSANDIFVGKDNADDFATLQTPGPITLTLAKGAVTTSSLGDPTTGRSSVYHGKEYGGLYVFGKHRVSITGGSPDYVIAHDAGQIAVRGGRVSEVSSDDRSVIVVTGGFVWNAFVRDHSVLHLRGGGVGTAWISGSGRVNVQGTHLTQSYGGYDGQYDFFVVTGRQQNGGYSKARPLQIYIENYIGKGNPTPRQFTFNGVVPSGKAR